MMTEGLCATLLLIGNALCEDKEEEQPSLPNPGSNMFYVIVPKLPD